MQDTGDRRQNTEYRMQKTGDRIQNTEDRRQTECIISDFWFQISDSSKECHSEWNAAERSEMKNPSGF